MNSQSIVGPGIPEQVETRSAEDPNKPLNWAQFAQLLSGTPTGSGKNVTPRGSLKVAAVYACVEVVSNAIARMPLITYERTAAGRVRAVSHPVYPLLRMRPNPDMSSFAWRKALVANRMLWGAAYSEIVRDGGGRIQGFVPIESERVTPYRQDGELFYRVEGARGGSAVSLMKRDVLHVPGLTFDGVSSLSVIAHARQQIGAQLAADEFSGKMLANGLRPSGVLSHPKTLGKEGQTNLRESINLTTGGPDNFGKFLILEEGMTWQGQTMPLEDAQFIESSQFRVEDIARMFGVQPHKIGHLLRSTNNNIEQQSLDFLGDTCQPITEAIEQEANWKIFGPGDIDRYYCEHLTQAIVQMDANARGQLYQRMFSVGAISPDEIRERENMNRLAEDRGLTAYIPGNMVPVPTPEQADALIDGWAKKMGSGSSASGQGGSQAGDPASTAPAAAGA